MNSLIDISDLQYFLDEKVEIYNKPSFIENDPISIPHLFKKKEDIEISAFFAANLAWGKRSIIIKKCKQLMTYMDNSPLDFILNYKEKDLENFKDFKHRTFNGIDLIYFIKFLNFCYSTEGTLEKYFADGLNKNDNNIENALIHFHNKFFSLKNFPTRTKKHIGTPLRKSACKKINMFLRWMVRKDKNGVDFGLWTKIKPNQLIIPCDVHVIRVSNKIGLINLEKANWNTAIQLTEKLKNFCNEDPIKYDFALFGLGAENKI